MARIISFYVPTRLKDRISRWIRPAHRAKILHFIPGYRGKYVWLPSGALWPILHQKPRNADSNSPLDIAG